LLEAKEKKRVRELKNIIATKELEELKRAIRI
jgi:hypothetical protein